MSELSKRTITSILLVILYMTAIFSVGIFKFFFILLILFISPLILREFCQMYLTSLDVKKNNLILISMLATLISISIASVSIFFGSLDVYFRDFLLLMSFLLFLKQNAFILIGLLIWFVCTIFFIFLVFSKSYKDYMHAISYILFAFVYIVTPCISAIYIHSLPDGVFWLFFIAWMTFTSDIFAYLSGKFFGKHPIGWKISPKKTYEGYLGGLFFQLLTTVCLYFIWVLFIPLEYPKLSYVTISLLSIFFYIISVLGDLVESSFKRGLEIKDSSGIIPGHGGLLDLFDSFLLSMPSFVILYSFM